MAGITHVRSPIAHWLGSAAELERRAADVLLVISQRSLDSDFELLKHLLDLPTTLRLPKDDVIAHRTPVGFDAALSPKARRNLEAWYADDIALFEICLKIRARQIAADKAQAA